MLSPRRLGKPVRGSVCASERITSRSRLASSASSRATAADAAVGLYRNGVYIGGGYVGLEVASTARKLGVQVRVIEREGRLPDLFVLELSSFQLETTSSLHAAAATILNVTEDHMDRYPFGLQQYRAAKLRVYENAKVCVVNADDALTMPVRGADDRCISFGITMGD